MKAFILIVSTVLFYNQLIAPNSVFKSPSSLQLVALDSSCQSTVIKTLNSNSELDRLCPTKQAIFLVYTNNKSIGKEPLLTEQQRSPLLSIRAPPFNI